MLSLAASDALCRLGPGGARPYLVFRHKTGFYSMWGMAGQTGLYGGFSISIFFAFRAVSLWDVPFRFGISIVEMKEALALALSNFQ